MSIRQNGLQLCSWQFLQEYYNKVLGESSSKNLDKTAYYIVFPVSDSKYVLHMINSEEFMMSDKNIENLFSIKDANQLLSYANRFNSVTIVSNFIKENENIVGTQELMSSVLGINWYFLEFSGHFPSSI